MKEHLANTAAKFDGFFGTKLGKVVAFSSFAISLYILATHGWKKYQEWQLAKNDGVQDIKFK